MLSNMLLLTLQTCESFKEYIGKRIHTKSVLFQQIHYQFLLFKDAKTTNNQLQSTSAVLSKPLFQGLNLLKAV